MPPRRKSLAERFWPKVQKGPGCWVWTASVGTHGYGQLNEGGEGRPIHAHRVSWVIHHGPVPDGKYVLHHCDNRLCVNPEHLYLGDHRDNMADMKRRKRFRVPGLRGERHPMARLTESDVREIRRLYENRTFTQAELAATYYITQAAVSLIVLRRTWDWLS